MVNFCVYILILNMGGKSNIFSILCFTISRKVKSQLKCKEKIFAVYGHGAVSDQTCQKWFAKFCARGFSLDDSPESGRLAEAAIKSIH